LIYFREGVRFCGEGFTMAKKPAAQSRRSVLVCVTNKEDLLVLQSALDLQSADPVLCHDIPEFCGKISEHIEAAFIGGKRLSSKTNRMIAQALEAQPDWSDLPIILSVSGGADSPVAAKAVRDLGNVSVLDHPFTPAALKNLLVVAFRSRERQRWIRGLAKDREQAVQSLLEAHEQLEQRVLACTSQLPERGPRQDKPLSSMIRILIADDHAVIRQGLSTSLGQEPDIAIVGEAADGKMALDKARTLHPDVILMDLGMPKMNGIEATRIIHTEMPSVRVVGLSMFEEKERVSAMFEAGAVAYLSKSCSVDTLTSAIRRCVGKPEMPIA
jgi:CheY-like chemotaxis protein